MDLVDLTANACIDGKFTGKAEIQRLVKAVVSSCERPISNANELLCGRIFRCEFGICCDIQYETNITSPDFEIVSTDYARIQSLDIKQGYGYGDKDYWTYIQFFPLVNRFTRNIIHYNVQYTSLKTIGKENFHGMIWLERLNLHANLIETVPKDTFQGLLSLKFIDLGKRHMNRTLQTNNKIFISS